MNESMESSDLVVPELPELELVAPTHPAALNPEHWAQIPDQQREEALERSAWLVFRGLPVAQALSKALEGMEQDRQQTETETDWAVIMAIARHWSGVRRTPDGHYHHRILDLAEKIERQAQAEAAEPGSVDDVSRFFIGLVPYPDFIPHVVRIYEERLEAILQLRQEQAPLFDRIDNPAT